MYLNKIHAKTTLKRPNNLGEEGIRFKRQDENTREE